jgi:hypothetical protein
MRPSYLKREIVNAVKANTPLMIWGPPGIGKSDIVRQAAQDMGREVIDLRLTYLDPVDLHGIPHVDKNKKTAWATPSFLPTGGAGLLFIDEIVSVPPAMQATAYQLILDRKLGAYHLPDEWFPIAAGNRMSDRAVVFKMPSALANRFIHLELEPHLEDWIEWATKHDINPTIVSFLRFRPELLNEPISPDVHAFASPRSWEYASRVLPHLSRETEFEVLKGTIGEGVATEFTGFHRVYRNLPDIDRLFKEPMKTAVPTDPATLYALCGALSYRVTTTTIQAAMQYIERIPSDFQIVFMRDTLRRHTALAHEACVSKWVLANASVITA